MQQAYLSTQTPNCFYILNGKGKIAITKESWNNGYVSKKRKAKQILNII